MKRGSLLVDAAISIPIFVLSICLILGIILDVGTEESDFRRLAEEAQSISIAYAASGLESGSVMHLKYGKERLAFKPFCGTESIEGDRLVYVFPKRGERYHVLGCNTLIPGQSETILTKSIRRKYKPCQICKPETLPDGSAVFLYTEGSKVYHKKSCATITKTYEMLTKKEAEERGYTPCKICLPALNESLQSQEK